MESLKISAVIIVKNAQKTLLECLESLKKFDEIILLDNGSSDDTLKIAAEFNESYHRLSVYNSEFIGFGALKNLAISYAENEWILSIDSDEVLESDFLRELENLQLTKENIIALPRKNLYKGEWIKACGWYPDYVNRIFNKTFTRFNENAVHESLIIPQNAILHKAQSGLRHYAYDSISALLEKMQRYSSLWAEQNLHKKGTMVSAILRGGFKFMRDYFLKKGIFYGYKGFVISLCNALGVFFKYAKLYELTKKIPTCSLIITTYNNKDFLSLVLDSIKALEYLPNEVLIADDGSSDGTDRLIKKYQESFPCPISHIFQEDKGFRAGLARNKAVKAAKYEYLIIIDGDMILESHFIKDHLKYAKHRVYLQGSRVILDEKTSKNMLQHKLKPPKSFKATRIAPLSYCIYKFSKITSKFFNKKELIRGVRACNMSLFKSDYDEISGFNEHLEGWGREDSEFVARFLFNGGEFRRLKFKGIAYHLWHNENSRAMFEQNHQIYLKTIQNKITNWRCP